MRSAITLISAAMLVFSQATGQKRVVAFAHVKENKLFKEAAMQILRAAEKGKIELCILEDINMPPRKYTWSEFQAKLPSLLFDQYSLWDSSKTYSEKYVVGYQSKRYASLVEGQKNKVPTDVTAWRPYVPPLDYIDISQIWLDYYATPKDSILQYAHILLESMGLRKYVASVRGDVAVEFLNANQGLWYERGFMNNLCGEVFLFDEFDKKPIADVWDKLDTVMHKISKRDIGDMLVLYRRSGNAMSQLFIAKYDEPSYDKIVMIDTFQVSNAMNRPGRKRKVHRLGDAFANPGLFNFRGVIDPPLKPFDERITLPAKSTVESIGVLISEDIAFKYQEFSPELKKDVTRFMDLLYAGIAEGALHVYSSDSLNHTYTPAEITRRWTYYGIQEWEPKADYYQDKVIYKNALYKALGDTRSAVPSENPDQWVRISSIGIYQPEEIARLGFKSQLIADPGGRILDIQIKSLELIAYDQTSGTFMRLGYLSYPEAQAFASKRNPELWKKTMKGLRENALIRGWEYQLPLNVKR